MKAKCPAAETPYLHTELLIAEAAGGQQQNRREGRDGAEEAEESGS